MDQAQLLELAQQLLLLISPLIAQGALQKIGEDTTDATQGLLKRAWAALQRRLTSNQGQSALTVYQSLPQSKDIQALVAQQLAASLQGDEAAIAELRELVRELRAATGAASAAPGRTHTLNMGDQAKVGFANAGDFHGNLVGASFDFSEGKRTITVPASASATPARSLPGQPRRRIDDRTLSADSVHFSYGHALLIGVGEYQRSGLTAPTTANDARALATLLRDPHSAAYPETQVQLLTDGAATRVGILEALDAFAQRLDSQATALVFFAGHGIRRAEGYYLLPHDYDPDNLARSAISARDFHDKVAAIRERAKRLIVLLNCCYAGGVGDSVLSETGAEVATAAPPPDFYQPLAVGSGQIVISSSRPLQTSGAASPTAPEHTVFGAQLLAALRGEAPGEAAGIGVFELFSYLSAHVPPDAQRISPVLRQNPLLYAHQLDQNIAVALRPGWQGGTLGADLNAQIRELAEIEVTLASYADETQAPPELLLRRDALLAQLG